MAICPVCGCKTDELDFVQGNIGGWSGNICSFCQKQIKGIDTTEGLNDAQLRWITVALSKDVQRDEALLSELRSLLGSDDSGNDEFRHTPSPNQYTPAQNTSSAISSGGVSVNNDVVKELLQRVEELEKEIRSMKRTALIKSILEICIPIILGIVILIVFFSSGLFDALSTLYNEFI